MSGLKDFRWPALNLPLLPSNPAAKSKQRGGLVLKGRFGNAFGGL